MMAGVETDRWTAFHSWAGLDAFYWVVLPEALLDRVGVCEGRKRAAWRVARRRSGWPARRWRYRRRRPSAGRPAPGPRHASELVVYDGQKEAARHERLIAKGQARLVLDHYLEALVKKPGAFPGATALEQAKSRQVHPGP
jgi:hypothetical protein